MQPGKHAYTRPNTHTYTKKPTKKQMEGIWKWVGKPSHNISPRQFAVYYNKRTKNGLNKG